jgi:transcriptional regulator with XRE-family HTH domain
MHNITFAANPGSANRTAVELHLGQGIFSASTMFDSAYATKTNMRQCICTNGYVWEGMRRQVPEFGRVWISEQTALESAARSDGLIRRNSIFSYPEILGRTILKRRRELNIDQDTLAEKTGIPQSTISRIERGEALLNSEQITYIADALGMTPSEFWIQADTVRKAVEAQGASILRERVSREMVRSSPLLVTGAALGAVITAVLGGHDDGL